MTEGLVGGGSLQLVTVCLSDDGVGETQTTRVDRSRPSRRWSRICALARRERSRSSFCSSPTHRNGVSGSDGERAVEANLLPSATPGVHLSAPILARAARAQRRVDRAAVPARRDARSRPGYPREQVVVIDEDLGVTGSGLSERYGFARLTAEVALGHAGLVLGLEVSRLARNNADSTGCSICVADRHRDRRPRRALSPRVVQRPAAVGVICN